MKLLASKIVFESKRRNNNMEIEKIDGTLATEPHEVLIRWQEYVECLYKADQIPSEITIEEETHVPEDEKGYDILEEEIEKALTEMKNRKACGIDNLPAEVLKSLGNRGSKEIFYLCNEIYDKGEWPEDFLATVMMPIKKKEEYQEM